jgi:hypothetical protein
MWVVMGDILPEAVLGIEGEMEAEGVVRARFAV